MLAGVHHPTTPAATARLTRRALLGGSTALAAGLVAACTSSPAPSPTGSDSIAPVPDADGQVRTSVAEEEAALIALYDAVLSTYPGLSAELAPIREQHLAHAEAMGGGAVAASAAPAVGSQPQAIAALIDAEQQAIAQRTAACESASGEEIARTLALIAASEAGHAEYLRGLT